MKAPIELDCIQMQNEAWRQSAAAMLALQAGDLETARHRQWMARHYHEQMWNRLLSLLLRDPII